MPGHAEAAHTVFERLRSHGSGTADSIRPLKPRQQRARVAWSDGATAFRAGDWTTAIQRFGAAAKDDNGMTDAWLGLHAAGHEQGHALLQLQSNSARLGEEQQRTGITIASRFTIGPYVSVPLRTTQDIWAAVGADYLDSGMYQHAQRVVLGLVPGAAGAPETAAANYQRAIDVLNPNGRYLAGRLELLRGDVQGAISTFGPLTGRGDALAASALVMTGTLYAGQGDLLQAMSAFDAAVATQARNGEVSPALAAEALTQSAHVAWSIGDEADALDRSARAAELFPHLPGLQQHG